MMKKNRALECINRIYRDIIQYRSACMDTLLIPKCTFFFVCMAIILDHRCSLSVGGSSNDSCAQLHLEQCGVSAVHRRF